MKYQISYTREEWRSVDVEANSKEEAGQLFFDGKVDWSTDHCYDIYIDYDTFNVKEKRNGSE